MATINLRDLGDFIRDQRRDNQISLRQLAKTAGVSNPYLSQIERGLRRPSAEILQQIAKALRISAEALYVQAGILEERPGDGDVPAAVLGDAGLTERQKQVLLEIYGSFRKENDDRPQPEAETPPAAPAAPRKRPTPARKAAAAGPRGAVAAKRPSRTTARTRPGAPDTDAPNTDAQEADQ